MLERYAQEIALSTSEVIGYHVIITDTKGIVIGASQKERLGTLHESSLRVIESGQGEIVDDNEARRLRGTYPGITYSIQAPSSKIAGTMAITGDPLLVRPFALIVKKQIEIMLREKKLLESAQTREQSLQNLIIDIAHYIPGSTDTTMLLVRAKDFGYDPSFSYIPIAIDLYQFGRRAYSIREESDNPEFYIQTLKNEILRDLRDIFSSPEHITTATGNSRYAVLYAIPKEEGLQEAQLYQRAKDKCSEVLESLSKKGLKAALGVGSSSRGIAELARSYKEAWHVLTLGKKIHRGPGVYTIHEYRIEELLVTISPPTRNRFIHRHVNVFRRQHDWPQLRETVIQWCENEFSLVRTAEALHIHRNTLIYRLDKIEKICGLDLKNFRECLKLYLAFQLDRFVEPSEQEKEGNRSSKE